VALLHNMPFWATVCKTVHPTLLDRCPVCLDYPVLSITLVNCGQTVGWIDMKLGTEVGLRPDHIVLDDDPAPPPKKRSTVPQSSAHDCCGQTAGWTKMPLGTEVGLGPGDIVLDEDPAPTKKGHSTTSFWPMSIMAKRLDGSQCHLVRR